MFLKRRDNREQPQDSSLLEDSMEKGKRNLRVVKEKRLRITGLTKKTAEISLPPCVWVIGHLFTYYGCHAVLQTSGKENVE